MNKRYAIPAIITIFVVLTIAAFAYFLPGGDNVEDSIKFTSDGNIIMPQSLCDAEELDVSPELEKRITDWWDGKLSGKHDGEVICTDD